MKKIFQIFIAVLLTMSLFTGTADAKRFGGGRSIGKSWSSNSNKGTSSFSKSAKTNRAPLLSGATKGMLMGLVAGGLIGSLLFGGGFNGLQTLDLLLIAGLAFLAFRFLRAKRQAAASANNSFFTGHNTNQQHDTQHSGISSDTEQDHNQQPQWFKEEEFIAGAKQHFVSLQKSWDENDMETIRTYCSPEFFAEIKQEREKITQNQTTEVLSLDAKLVELQQTENSIIANVQFKAVVKEDQYQTNLSNEVSEVWSVEHSKHSANGDWLIVGITQD